MNFPAVRMIIPILLYRSKSGLLISLLLGYSNVRSILSSACVFFSVSKAENLASSVFFLFFSMACTWNLVTYNRLLRLKWTILKWMLYASDGQCNEAIVALFSWFRCKILRRIRDSGNASRSEHLRRTTARVAKNLLLPNL